uniref:Neprosin activation peptide domain-containing protein n=1 Tax=Brassica oleracea TaxID=3712 RepID=A0A3P6FCX0_BRAOL|nr:unnamed protein product [Brassica oleracea]
MREDNQIPKNLAILKLSPHGHLTHGSSEAPILSSSQRSQWQPHFYVLLSLCGGVSAATPVLTVHSSDGDVIDCVKKMNQPSLTNPLLKNHSFQVCCVCVFF